MHTPIAPTMSASFSVIAERFRRAGQSDRAVALCREGLELYPDHLSARATLGCALLELGEHLEAHRELQAVLKRAPDNLAAIRGLAELHARGIDEQDAHDMEAAHEAQALAVAQAVQEETVEPPNSVPEPMLELQPVHFEIEDVIHEADELFDLVGEPTVNLEFDLSPGSDSELTLDDLDPVVPAEPVSSEPPAPIPVPALSAGPIAVLDEWLTRIRARRSELLSEYAAS